LRIAVRERGDLMRVSGVRAIMEGTRGQGSADAFRLAREEMGRSWPSYMLGTSIVLFLGMSAAVSLSVGVSEFEHSALRNQSTERFYSAFFADYLFLLVLAVLGANTILRYYTRSWRDNSSSRLAFLGGLPISAGALVGSRALCMLSTFVLGSLAFFLPVYFLSNLGEELGAGAYLSFCGVWVGYGLLGAGLWLLLEFGVSDRGYSAIFFCFALTLMVAVIVLDWEAGLSLVERTAQLSQSGFGALSSILSILAGGAAFVLLARAAVRRIRKDKPVGEPLRASVGA
jgi:hypothetical protein